MNKLLSLSSKNVPKWQEATNLQSLILVNIKCTSLILPHSFQSIQNDVKLQIFPSYSTHTHTHTAHALRKVLVISLPYGKTLYSCGLHTVCGLCLPVRSSHIHNYPVFYKKKLAYQKILWQQSHSYGKKSTTQERQFKVITYTHE